MTPAQYAAILAAPLNPAVWRIDEVTPAQYVGILAAISAAGVSIGGPVSGGVANSVLFVGAGGILAQDNSSFKYSAGQSQAVIAQLSVGKIEPQGTVPATVPGLVIASWPIYDSSGNVVGAVPIYDSIS